MSRSVEAVITRLKGMIDRNGPHHLSDKPYQVYVEIPVNRCADSEMGGALIPA